MTTDSRRRASLLILPLGLLILLSVWVIGLRTGSFLVHVAFPLGFWITSDGLMALVGFRPLVQSPVIVARMVGIGAAVGLVLDFHMVELTRILDLTAVTSPWLALAMYLGWGLALPAAYSSFRLASCAVALGRPPVREGANRAPRSLASLLAAVGTPLAVLALFWRLWVGEVPAWFVVPVFAGLWLIAEHIQVRRERSSLMGSLLVGNPRPLLALALAAIPFTLLWEGLNAVMGSWRYRDIFWLEPHLLGVPFVVFFGYVCGYYVLFLSLYGAFRNENEDELALWEFKERRGSPTSSRATGRI